MKTILKAAQFPETKLIRSLEVVGESADKWSEDLLTVLKKKLDRSFSKPQAKESKV